MGRFNFKFTSASYCTQTRRRFFQEGFCPVKLEMILSIRKQSFKKLYNRRPYYNIKKNNKNSNFEAILKPWMLGLLPLF